MLKYHKQNYWEMALKCKASPRQKCKAAHLLLSAAEQEEEESIRPGTRKDVIFKVLKTVGSAGMSTANIIDAAREFPSWNRAEGEKAAIYKVVLPFLHLALSLEESALEELAGS